MAFIVKRDLIVIPVDIPVGANGQQVIISSNTDPNINGTYTKDYAGGQIAIADNPFTYVTRKYSGPNGWLLVFVTNSNKWEIGSAVDFGDTGTGYGFVTQNSSSNQDFIPTTNWSPSITITAA